MDDRPETGGEWMSLVNRRLARLERRQRTGVPEPAALLVPTGDRPPGWETVPGLTAPSGWVYVRQAVVPDDI